jgi:lipopolysaccharide export system protein LptA
MGLIQTHNPARILFCLTMILLLASNQAYSQKKRRIDILGSDALMYAQSMGKNVKKLVGNVRLKHEDVFMTCDSAYLYDNDRVVEAFGSIHVQQGDTLHLYGDRLRYMGETKKAEVRQNVRLVDNETTVHTDYLDFDIQNNYGHYFHGGVVTNENATLSSREGYYYSKPELFYYKDSVKIVHPDYTITCDSLHYQSRQQIAYFRSPTHILGKDYEVFCRKGWYNMKTEVARFIDNARVVNGARTIRGDSIYYDRGKGYGKILLNAEIHDTTERIILRGNYAEYSEKPEWTVVTDNALFIQYTRGDSLFLHADTLRSVTDTVMNYRILRAFYHVKFFKDDMQGVCDSLSYSFADSVIYLYYSPVLWTDNNQLTSDSMRIFTRLRRVDRLEMYHSSFIISMEDSLRYNQIKGKNMTGFFKEGKLYRINVNGNGETIYYAKDQEEIVGVNKAESSNIVIFIKNSKVDKIRLINQPAGILHPPAELPPAELKLKGFVWYEEQRPKSKYDIFRTTAAMKKADENEVR